MATVIRRKQCKLHEMKTISPYINCVHLQVWCEWIRKAHISWKCTKNEIPHLDAACWNNITEAEVVVAQKFRKIMQ